MHSKKRLIVFLVLLAALALAGWLIWKRSPSADIPLASPRPVPADPRLTFPTLFRNVRPEVKYVGDETCASCHGSQTSGYHEHPMAHSMSLVSRAPPIERYDAAAHNPFEKFGFDFQIEHRGDHAFHKILRRDQSGREALALAHEARYAVGSGSHGRAYLFTLDNFVFRTPINWFSQGKRWDVAPYVAADSDNHYFQGVDPQCIYCHGNQAEPDANSLNRYRSPLADNMAIGCERCHGPGELHVELRSRGEVVEGVDNTIVNPARLPPPLRESICQQCHLHGEIRVTRRGRELYDFRPGLPLQLFWSVFLKPPEQTRSHQAVSHVEQMFASKCFDASNGKLGCITCHDPHHFPKAEEKLAIYRKACLSCHQETSCPVPLDQRKVQNGDSCFACHMPRLKTVDIAHTATSDHRIPRRAGEPIAVSGGPQHRFSEALPLVHFFEAFLDPQDKEPSRDFAVGLIELAEPMPAVPARTRYARIALPVLSSALEDSPDDLHALHAKGFALWLLDFPTEAMTCFESVLQVAPKREATLFCAARLATILGQREKALSYWQQAAAANPYSPTYHTQLGWAYAESKDWAKTIRECDQALRINPMSIEAHKLLIWYYLQNDRKSDARGALEKLVLLDPPNAKELRQRFGELMK